MGFSYFTRRYFRNHCYFLFLRLVICLNSAGSLARLRSWFRIIKFANNTCWHKRSKYRCDFYLNKLEAATNLCDWSQAQISTTIQTMIVILHFSCWFVDPQANVVPGIPETAICVQVIAAQYILQFTIVIALCCALHRFASRVIHRSE